MAWHIADANCACANHRVSADGHSVDHVGAQGHCGKLTNADISAQGGTRGNTDEIRDDAIMVDRRLGVYDTVLADACAAVDDGPWHQGCASLDRDGSRNLNGRM